MGIAAAFSAGRQSGIGVTESLMRARDAQRDRNILNKLREATLKNMLFQQRATQREFGLREREFDQRERLREEEFGLRREDFGLRREEMLQQMSIAEMEASLREKDFGLRTRDMDLREEQFDEGATLRLLQEQGAALDIESATLDLNTRREAAVRAEERDKALGDLQIEVEKAQLEAEKSRLALGQRLGGTVTKALDASDSLAALEAALPMNLYGLGFSPSLRALQGATRTTRSSGPSLAERLGITTGDSLTQGLVNDAVRETVSRRTPSLAQQFLDRIRAPDFGEMPPMTGISNSDEPLGSFQRGILRRREARRFGGVSQIAPPEDQLADEEAFALFRELGIIE